MDLERLSSAMRGRLVLDGRNCLDAHRVRSVGLRYEGIGRGGHGPAGEED